MKMQNPSSCCTGVLPVQHRRDAGATRKAFTLIEFIVVATIIGILAALIVPRFVGRIGGARQAVAKQKIAVIEAKILEFQADCGRFPSSQEGMDALLRAPGDVTGKWKGPYLKEKDVLDPWEVTFGYRYPGQHNADFDLFTLGADHQEGGEDENADVGNW